VRTGALLKAQGFWSRASPVERRRLLRCVTTFLYSGFQLAAPFVRGNGYYRHGLRPCATVPGKIPKNRAADPRARSPL
jgi:hypothetical protein